MGNENAVVDDRDGLAFGGQNAVLHFSAIQHAGTAMHYQFVFFEVGRI